MAEKEDLCWNCGKHPIKVKDYREVDGCSGKVLSCEYCASLNSEWHYRVRRDNLDPKKVLDE